MKYGRVITLAVMAILFSGCLQNISGSLQVVQVNVSVVMKDNRTLIESITAKGFDKVSKLDAPGMILPEKFPAIYAEILQEYNISHPGSLKSISIPNGQVYTGPGNYTLNVELMADSLNKSQPISLYSEIVDNQSQRIARRSVQWNWTE